MFVTLTIPQLILLLFWWPSINITREHDDGLHLTLVSRLWRDQKRVKTSREEEKSWYWSKRLGKCNRCLATSRAFERCTGMNENIAEHGLLLSWGDKVANSLADPVLMLAHRCSYSTSMYQDRLNTILPPIDIRRSRLLRASSLNRIDDNQGVYMK